jgi:hypothetical protein
MRAFLRYAVIVFGMAALTGRAAYGIQVFAQVDTRTEIYVGESFTYNIIIDGENKPGEVDVTPLAKFNPRSAGNQDVSQTSISIINGKTTQKIIKRFVMSYQLSAAQAGKIQLPPVTVAIDAKQYRTNPVQVNILQPGTTDKLDLEVALSEQQCYVGQPVVMTVKFYVAADIGDFQFNIPAFGSDAFYTEDPDVSDPQAKLYRLHTGMTVLVSQYRVTHKGMDSILLSFSKVLIPKHSGQIAIEPATVSADVAVGLARSRDSFFDDFGFFGRQKQYKRFMVNSKAQALTVKPLPEEGKPAGFYGLVGRYTISASATPTKVYAGDPITFTIKVGGSKYLKPVEWPALEEVAELAADFKIPSEKASPTIENAQKIFTQTIRANNDKVAEIPPIPLAFFDPDKGRYVVVKTEPIKLEVAETKTKTAADAEGGDSAPVKKEVEATKKRLCANYEDPTVVLKTTRIFSPAAAMTSPAYALLWSAPLAGLVLSALIKIFTQTSPEKVAIKRRRRAGGKAVRQLKKISSCEPQQRHELLASIMKQYLGERFGRTAGSLTADDCYEIIAANTRDEQAAQKYRQTIATCEAARYAAGHADVDVTQIQEAVRLVRTVEKKSKR